MIPSGLPVNRRYCCARRFASARISRTRSFVCIPVVEKRTVEPQGGVSNQKVEDTRTALRELGLADNVSTE